jgi:hypothetical protein
MGMGMGVGLEPQLPGSAGSAVPPLLKSHAPRTIRTRDARHP